MNVINLSQDITCQADDVSHDILNCRDLKRGIHHERTDRGFIYSSG